VLLWAALSVITQRFSLQSLSGVSATASFFTIAATGQMLVIASGGGNVDLSIPSMITLSAFTVMSIDAGSDVRLLIGLPVIIAMGVMVGLVNAVLVQRLRIPAIIATLAVGYVLTTGTLLLNRAAKSLAPSPILGWIGGSKLAGVPVILIVAILLTAATEYLLSRTAYGRMLLATGQNATAARLAGVKVDRTITIAFVMSAVLGALDGALLSAHTNGAFLDMGSPYLLQSVGAVVIGGSLIFGGSATAIGTFLGSALLVLIVTAMQIAGLSGGAQDVVEGLVIIAVLAGADSGRGKAGMGPRLFSWARGLRG
jgi:ribose transport system permease protein